MKVLPYDPQNKAGILAEALVVLLSGGTVVYPTETAYGLGADFFSPRAYQRVFAIKNRSERKPLPVIIPNFQYAQTIVSFTPEASKLAQKYWPGPLTLVLPFLYAKEWTHHGDAYLALRVSSHPFAASLAQAFGRPLIATSANISCDKACYSAEAVIRQMSQSHLTPDLVIDMGDLPDIEPSTMVRVDDQGIAVLRSGPIRIKL